MHQLANGVDERAEVDRFHDVGVRAELVAADQILFFARRGEHDDRNRLQRVVGLQCPEHVEAIDLGHFQIQQQHRRISGRPVGVRVAPVEVVEGFGAVPHDHHFVREVDLAERRKR